MTDDVPGTHWQDADGFHIDTRGLQPPDPLVAIIGHLDQPSRQGLIHVYLDRDPVYLFPELEARGWHFEYAQATADEVHLILTNKK